MPIEITNGNPHRVPYDSGEGAQVNGVRSDASSQQKQTGSPSTFDTVSITDTASNLQRLAREIGGLPVVDSQRVEDIRQAIANGSYEIDPQATAEKLIGFEQALGRDGD